MMSDFYDEEELINVLKSHLLPEDENYPNWDKVIREGEIYPHEMNGVDGCYIYSVPTHSDMNITVFVHPFVCSEVYYDAWTSKDVYMGRDTGQIGV